MLLTLQGTQLRCVDQDGIVRWSLTVDDLILIAEYTTNEGPLFDDYFLIFCTIQGEQAQFATCSFYANGVHAVLNAIGEKLGSPLTHQLCDSMEWNSRVLWPAELAGQKYFRCQEAKPENLRDRLRGVLLGPAFEMFLADPVQQYVRAQFK